MTSAKRRREHELAKRLLLREMRRREATAFYCKGKHPNSSQAEHGRLCSFQIFPRKVAVEALASCPRCGQRHIYDGVQWIPADALPDRKQETNPTSR